MREVALSFECFGGTVEVRVTDADPHVARGAALAAQRELLALHAELSRFREDSELSRLNACPLETVPVTPGVFRLAEAAIEAGRVSGGLVDATVLPAVERAGYTCSLNGTGQPSFRPSTFPPRQPPVLPPAGGWQSFSVDPCAGTVSRPPGVRLDSGGLAKGLAADMLASRLERHAAFVVDCAGDVRVGGRARLAREILVEDPSGGDPLHRFTLSRGAVATSGTGKRSWLRPDGSRAHHLIDPRTGEPAETGVVQATALAPTGFLAEVLAKSALLAGPDRGPRRLAHGGLLVLADGSVQAVGGAGALTAAA